MDRWLSQEDNNVLVLCCWWDSIYNLIICRGEAFGSFIDVFRCVQMKPINSEKFCYVKPIVSLITACGCSCLVQVQNRLLSKYLCINVCIICVGVHRSGLTWMSRYTLCQCHMGPFPVITVQIIITEIFLFECKHRRPSVVMVLSVIVFARQLKAARHHVSVRYYGPG